MISKVAGKGIKISKPLTQFWLKKQGGKQDILYLFTWQ